MTIAWNTSVALTGKLYCTHRKIELNFLRYRESFSRNLDGKFNYYLSIFAVHSNFSQVAVVQRHGNKKFVHGALRSWSSTMMDKVLWWWNSLNLMFTSTFMMCLEIVYTNGVVPRGFTPCISIQNYLDIPGKLLQNGIDQTFIIIWSNLIRFLVV